jgi:hypothetical protein
VRPTASDSDALREHHPHRLQGTCEGIKNHAEDLESNAPEERLITRFPEDNRGVALSLRQRDMALGDLPLDEGAIGERKTKRTLGHSPMDRHVASASNV